MLDKIILAYAIKNKKFTMDLASSATKEFFKAEYQAIYDIVIKHFNDPKFKEIPTSNVVLEQLQKMTDNNELINRSLSLFEEAKQTDVVDAEFTWYVEKIRTRHNENLQRECIRKSRDLLLADNVDQDKKIDQINKVIKDTVTKIDSIYKKQTYNEGSLNESAKERFARYQEIESNPELAKGILTGFKEFDRISGGLHPGELMIIAGDTGTGKSVLMHNIGVNAYLGKNDPFCDPKDIVHGSGYNILYFSLEMPRSSLERRVDACMGGLYYSHIRDGALTEEEKKKYFQLLKFQSIYPKNFHIVDMAQGVTTREIELKYMELAETKFKPDLVIVDYLGIMDVNNSSKAMDDWLKLGQISAELHEFARTYNIPVITGSQVNRPKEGKTDYSTNRIARSAMVTNHANVIIQIGNREEEYLRSDMPIYIVKMRDGEKGAFTLSKDMAKMKIIDMLDENFDGDASDDELGV